MKALKADHKAAQDAAEAKKLAETLARLELESVEKAVADPEDPTGPEKEALRQAQLKFDKAVKEREDADDRLRQRQAALAQAGGSANLALGTGQGEAAREFFGRVILCHSRPPRRS